MQDFGLEQDQQLESSDEDNRLYGEEGTDEQETSNDVTQDSQFYSHEEFVSLLKKSPLHMDESKIPAELKPFWEATVDAYKSMQADYTRKTQEIAKMRGELQQQKPATIFEAYMQDPDGVSNYIDQEILKASQEADYDTAEKLRLLKTRLIEERTKHIERMISGEKLSSQVYGQILSAIPDYETKRPKLSEFATKELGLTNEEIALLTDPRYTGNLAVKLTIAVNKIYDMLSAKKSAEEKIKKQKPSPLARSGSAEINKSAPKSVEDIFYG